ncbi:MAG: hypothetical protein PVH15_08715 [Syntrophobacterales bacterium]
MTEDGEQRTEVRWQLGNDTETRGDGDAAKKLEVDGDSILMVFLLNSGF